MPLEGKGLVEPSTFSTVKFESSSGTVSRNSNRVPLTIVYGDGVQPYFTFLAPQTIEVVSEAQSGVFDLQIRLISISSDT